MNILTSYDRSIHIRLWYLGMDYGNICHCIPSSHYSICNFRYSEVKKLKYESKISLDHFYTDSTIPWSSSLSFLGAKTKSIMITLTSLLFIGNIFRFLFGILWAILIVYTLLDLFRSNKPTNTKLLWLIVILIAPILGSIIYFVAGRTNRI